MSEEVAPKWRKRAASFVLLLVLLLLDPFFERAQEGCDIVSRLFFQLCAALQECFVRVRVLCDHHSRTLQE